MKTVGLIVEYNPLHNGHVYHFQQSKRLAQAEAVIAVMSGSFLQRGEPALVSKWARTEMALAMGADVVIELPVAYASQAAEWFAFGAVSALEATGVVDAFCFGSESGDLEQLASAARRICESDQLAPSSQEQSSVSATAAEAETSQDSRNDNYSVNVIDNVKDNVGHDVRNNIRHNTAGSETPSADTFQQLIRQRLKSGQSYPSAYADAALLLLENHGDSDWIRQPNNTLGLHYLLALARLQGRMQPLTIARQGAGYNDPSPTDARIASATALRKLMAANAGTDALAPYVPSYTHHILKRELEAGRAPVDWERLFSPLFARIATASPDQLAALAEVNEGLENRMLRSMQGIDPSAGAPFEQWMTALKTKRYTRTKLQRAMTRILLQHGKEALSAAKLRSGVPYLRVLGFSPLGKQLLKRMRSTATVPVVTRVAAEHHPFLTMDIQAATVHASAFRKPSRADLFRDYFQPPLGSDGAAT